MRNVNRNIVLKRILITAIITLSLLLLFVIMGVLLGSEKNISAYYTFSSSSLSDSDYLGSSEFHINSLDGLKKFAEAVKSGKNFSGKTVILTADINCNNEDITIGSGDITSDGSLGGISFSSVKCFSGTFDGNKKTLSNIKLKSHMDNGSSTGGPIPLWRGTYYFGLFPCLGNSGVVRNLVIDTISADKSFFGWFGNVSGYAGAINSWMNSNAQVTNCIVRNADSSIDIPFTNAQSCLVQNSNCSLNSSSSSNKNSVKYTSDTVFELSTDISNKNNLDTNYWHIPPTNEYNNGRPMLKSFITFDTINITRNNSSYGSVNKSSIQLPSGGSYSHQINNNTLTIYGNAIVATPNSGYVFDGWSVNLSQKSITANFKLQTYWVDINILNPSNAQDYLTATMTITYSYGNKTYTGMTDQPGGNQTYAGRSDLGNSQYNVPMNTTITISNIQIIMENPDRYYIAEIKDGAGNTYNTASMTYTVTSSDSQTINIYVKLKGYDVVFE